MQLDIIVLTQKWREWQDWKIEVQTTDSYSPWWNKAESDIKIIKGKANIRRVQRNIPKKVWDFGMVWEADIYFGL